MEPEPRPVTDPFDRPPALVAVPPPAPAPVANTHPTPLLRGRLLAAGWRGRARWAAFPSDRAEIAARFALPLQDTPHARRASRVVRRHYALTQRCLALESNAGARAAVGVVFEGAAPPERAVYAFVHSPVMWVLLYGLANARINFSPVVEDWYWHDTCRGIRDGALAAQGGAAIAADRGFAEILDILERGGNPGLAVDVPGRTPVRFLDKPASVRSGLARLAQAAGVPVVPIRGAFLRGRPIAVIGAPIAPRDDVVALLRDVLATLEAPLLRHPERWMPYTGDLWPDRCEPYRAAYDEDPPAGEVGSPA